MRNLFRSVYQKLFPEPVRRLRHDIRANCVALYQIVTNAVFDTYRHAKFSSSFKKTRSRTNERSLLTFYYHKLEKGLALPSPRAGFGARMVVLEFLPLLKSYIEKFGPDETVATSLKALEAWVTFHDLHPSKAIEAVEEVKAFLDAGPTTAQEILGGVIAIDGMELKSRWQMDFARFAAARHSIRVFSDKPVDRLSIHQAVSIAQRAPSVCNRQAWGVYALTDSASIRDALALQSGNAGFGDQIPCLLLVTCDTAEMIFTAERNQIWIDGGLFSMALIYALQSIGMATCCLNLCVSWATEKKIARFYKMRDSERPVMMIAVGHIPDRLFVANSMRKPLEAVLTWADEALAAVDPSRG